MNTVYGVVSLSGNLLRLKLNSACYNCTVVIKILFLLLKDFLCFALLEFPGREKKHGKRTVSMAIVRTVKPPNKSATYSLRNARHIITNFNAGEKFYFSRRRAL